MHLNRHYVLIIGVLLYSCMLGCEKDKKMNSEIDETYSQTHFSLFDQHFGKLTAMLNTQDEHLIVLGEAKERNGRTFRMMKLNRHSDIIWFRSFNNNHIEGVHTIIENWKGALIVAGFNSDLSDGISDAVILKTGANGVSKWRREFGNDNKEMAECIIRTTDQHYLVAGRTIDDGEQDLLVAKIDDQGDVVLTKSIDLYREDMPHSIHRFNGGYVISCLSKIDSLSESFDEVKYLTMLELDLDLNLLWKKTHRSIQWEPNLDLIKTKNDKPRLCIRKSIPS